jgi:hypothetical protein
LLAVIIGFPKIKKQTGTDREANMANVQFFHSILIGLVAVTLASGAMAGALAMQTYAAGGVHDVSHQLTISGWER